MGFPTIDFSSKVNNVAFPIKSLCEVRRLLSAAAPVPATIPGAWPGARAMVTSSPTVTPRPVQTERFVSSETWTLSTLSQTTSTILTTMKSVQILQRGLQVLLPCQEYFFIWLVFCTPEYLTVHDWNKLPSKGFCKMSPRMAYYNVKMISTKGLFIMGKWTSITDNV